MANHTKSRPRARPARSVGWALEPCGTSPGVLRITVGKAQTEYLLEPLPSDFGLAYRPTKPEGEQYHVLLAADGRHSCECKGFLRWNRCKHVFVTTENTLLDHKGNLWRTFVGCLKRAGIERKPFAPHGRVLEHVDLHSLRRTFTTSLIVGGTDPKTVQELLGHKTLAMTMKVYAKVRRQTKRQALGRLPCAAGATPPEHVVELPPATLKPVQFGERFSATKEGESQEEAV